MVLRWEFLDIQVYFGINNMIIVKSINGEIIAKGKNFKTIDAYFKLEYSHSKAIIHLLNKPLKSKKFNINVVLDDDKTLWQKNQSIIFLKNLEPSK
jgi:hypothetical protein